MITVIGDSGIEQSAERIAKKKRTFFPLNMPKMHADAACRGDRHIFHYAMRYAPCALHCALQILADEALDLVPAVIDPKMPLAKNVSLQIQNILQRPAVVGLIG